MCIYATLALFGEVCPSKFHPPIPHTSNCRNCERALADSVLVVPAAPSAPPSAHGKVPQNWGANIRTIVSAAPKTG